MRRIWLLAAATTLGCLLGVSAAYGVGMFAYGVFGETFIENSSLQDEYNRFQLLMDQHGILAVALISVTPIPLVVVSIGAGDTRYHLLCLSLSSV